MNTFLEFLNTAEFDTLIQVYGVNRQLAGAIISARPFESEEDVLKVKGMGRATLARIQSFAQEEEKAPENSAMIPVQKEAAPAPFGEMPPAQDEAPQRASFFQRLGRAFKWFFNALLRLVMIALLIGAVGLLLSLALPYIQSTFLTPLEQNTTRVAEMQTEVTQLREQVDALNERMTTIEGSVEAHTAAIAQLEEMQATLETQMEENNDAVLLELKHEVMFTRALDVLARARLYLAQSNFGLAKADVQTARNLLADLENETNDVLLAQVVARLDLALGNLPDFPVVASGDLEIAWQILISGNAPAIPATPTHTPTPTPLEETTTPTAIPTGEATSTP